MKKYFTFILVSLISLPMHFLSAQNSTPCPCCQEAYRQFDFWVGDWQTTSNDQIAGTNKIVFLQDSCVIQENWTSSSPGYTGTSYNFYDPQDGKWHQTWIDNQGQSLRLIGGLIGENMVLSSGPMKDLQGNTVLHRITWTPNADGSVRQLWESTKQDEEDWKVLFDGVYRKKG